MSETAPETRQPPLIRDVHLENFKSISDLKLSLGRVNVFIGENGCGKSNFLEGLAFASAGWVDKLDNEFLASRGIRATEARFMLSAFAEPQSEHIRAEITDANMHEMHVSVFGQKGPFAKWISGIVPVPEDMMAMVQDTELTKAIETLARVETFREMNAERLRDTARRAIALLRYPRNVPAHPLDFFAIYSPENTALRAFSTEGAMLPVGIKGEGLFRLLKVVSTDDERWTELKQNLRLLQWFDDAEIPSDQLSMENSFRIKDKFLAQDLAFFDQRSANEGFLFLLFYFALVISPDTPPFFAIDNVDTSLNPKTATALTSRLATLAAKYNKQIILTTHSPAVLDGLDLKDDEQRLFVFFRNKNGETRARRVMPPQPLGNETPIKLSEAFMRGLLGGLPLNF